MTKNKNDIECLCVENKHLVCIEFESLNMKESVLPYMYDLRYQFSQKLFIGTLLSPCFVFGVKQILLCTNNNLLCLGPGHSDE